MVKFFYLNTKTALRRKVSTKIRSLLIFYIGIYYSISSQSYLYRKFYFSQRQECPCVQNHQHFLLKIIVTGEIVSNKNDLDFQGIFHLKIQKHSQAQLIYQVNIFMRKVRNITYTIERIRSCQLIEIHIFFLDYNIQIQQCCMYQNFKIFHQLMGKNLIFFKSRIKKIIKCFF